MGRVNKVVSGRQEGWGFSQRRRQDDSLLESSRPQLHPVLQCGGQGRASVSQDRCSQAGSHIHQVRKVGGRKASRQEDLIISIKLKASFLINNRQEARLNPRTCNSAQLQLVWRREEKSFHLRSPKMNNSRQRFDFLPLQYLPMTNKITTRCCR